ncbi:hypothetical protein Tco_0428346 [Tanacetum coccineum]
MAAPTIPVFAEENLRDPIEIRVDVVHPVPVVVVAFPAVTIMKTLDQHEEAIRGIQEHLLGVPIQVELSALRFRLEVDEAENASLRATIRTIEAIETVLVAMKGSLVLRLSVSWLRFRSPTVRTERTSRSS